ncbi:MAG: competence/damage-inducible protein A [Verrucomicrobiota bacterium]
MEIEIINTGSELMLGRVLNTHQQWLCSQLANLGLVVNRQLAISDEGPLIQNTVRESLGRADLIITTGGLGPTSDDITRDLVAELLGRKLAVDSKILSQIENFFAQRKRRMPESTKVQAMIPDGAQVLQNENGTAPGLVMEINPNSFRHEHKPTLLVMLPGPPRELRPMFTNQVIPCLKKHYPTLSPFVCRTLKTTGLGESFVEEMISARLKTLIKNKLVLGYCARVGEVDVRISARGPNAENHLAEAEQIIRDSLGLHIFGTEDDSLELVVVRLLIQRKETLALAESCTGGFIANRITNVPGASEVFTDGLVTYSNESKQRLLGVSEAVLAQHGAVSEETVRAMAEGARLKSKTDYALAVTGIAGPGGGTKEKPVGTVFIAFATSENTVSKHHVFQYDRETFKFVTSQTALELLWRKIVLPAAD